MATNHPRAAAAILAAVDQENADPEVRLRIAEVHAQLSIAVQLTVITAALQDLSEAVRMLPR